MAALLYRRSSADTKLLNNIGLEKTRLTEKDIVNGIIKRYEKGVESLIEVPAPKKNEVYMMLVLKGPNWFIKKYIDKAMRKNSTQSESSGIILKNLIETENDDLNKIDKEKLNNNYNNRTMKYKTENDVRDKKYESQKIVELLYDVFSELNKTEEQLIEKILNKYAKMKSENLRENNEAYFSIYTEILKEDDEDNYNLNDKYIFYYEFTFEDFIVLFCSIIAYYTGLTIRLEMRSENSKKVMLLIYGENEKSYNILADYFGYEMQLNPYALEYEELLNKYGDKFLNDSNYLMGKVSHYKGTSNLLQFHQLDMNNCLHYPPYVPFEIFKKNKFRRYSFNDDYHECVIDPTSTKCTKNCSQFRNIDKHRLILASLKQILNFSYLYKKNFVSMIIYKKNYNKYKDKINIATKLSNTLKIYSRKSYLLAISTIRNFYGESIAYYFLWVSFISSRMIFPSIVSCIIKLGISKFSGLLKKGSIKYQTFSFDYYYCALILLCLFIEIWATFALNAWKQHENLYKYFWGMEKQRKNLSQSIFFVSNKVEPFILGERINTVSIGQKIFKRLMSYIFLFILIFIRIYIVIMTFSIKISENIDMKTVYILASISGITTKVFGYFDEFIAYKLSLWENHETTASQQNANAILLMILEFSNHFLFLLYIAFYKPYRLKCLNDSCLEELEKSAYILLFWDFLFTLIELLSLFLKIECRVIFGNSRKKNTDFFKKPHSIEHQINCEGKNNLIPEYNRKMIRFGYVLLFSVGAPFIPFIVFLGNLFDIFLDTNKIFHMYRIELVDGCDGIGIYNSIFKTIYIIGMLINMNLILFTSMKFCKFESITDLQQPQQNKTFINNVLFLAIVENLMLFIMKSMKIRYEPIWFRHLAELKDLYDKKYYNRHLYDFGDVKMDFSYQE